MVLTGSLNNTKWLAALVFAAALGAGVLILRNNGLSWTHTLTDALVTATLLVVAVWGGVAAVNNYPTKVGLFIYAMIVGVVAGMAGSLLDKLFLIWWFEGDADYLGWLKASQEPRVVIYCLTTCWLVTVTAMARRTLVVEEQFKTMTDAATLHKEAELFKLRQQLQPHFLYNSLNSITALIMTQPVKAQEMIGKLSDFLRTSVKREGREHIPIDEELEYIEAYLAIESVRFGDRLKITYNKDYTDSATIPPFLLQPILENAIKFGLYGKIGQVEINIWIKLEEPDLIITVANPYDPQHQPPGGTGFGLEGIRRRLYLLYARTDLLELKRWEGHQETDEWVFSTTLKIPQIYAESNIDRR